MNFILKIEGAKHKSQIIILDSNKMTFIDDLKDFVKNKESKEYTRYDGREVFAEYIGKSRIDSEPMFKIDTLQLDRDDKISQIIN